MKPNIWRETRAVVLCLLFIRRSSHSLDLFQYCGAYWPHDASMIRWPMSFRRFVHRVLLTLAVVGLIMAPAARPAMAMMNMASDAVSSVAAADMPCCPDGMMQHADGKQSGSPDNNSGKPDCGTDCPMMAACMVTTLNIISDVPTLTVPITMSQTVYPELRTKIGSLARAPTPRPPNA